MTTTNTERIKEVIDYLERNGDCGCNECLEAHEEFKIRAQVQKEIDALNLLLEGKELSKDILKQKLDESEKELSELKKDVRDLLDLWENGKYHKDIFQRIKSKIKEE